MQLGATYADSPQSLDLTGFLSIGVTGFEPDIPTRRKFSKEGGFEHRLFGVVNNLVNKTTFHQSEISQKQFIISRNNHAVKA